jgi:hypothetical protein
MPEFNNQIRFRQAVQVHWLSSRKRTQLKRVATLLLRALISSFPGQICSPGLRLQWHPACDRLQCQQEL